LRIATLIISLILSLAVFFQSCAATIGGSLGEEFGEGKPEITEAQDLSAAGAFGIFAALLWVTGAALVLAKPKASIWIYSIAGLFLLIAGTAGYGDGYIWAVVSVIFALMSWRGVRERRNKDERERARYQADIATAAAAMQQQPHQGPPPPLQ
jgi:membrane protein implicated in regulation of membrane protease activity